LLGIASTAGAEDQQGGEITLQNRAGFAFLLGTPTGEVARTSSSEIIRIVSDLLRVETDFAIQVLDAAVMVECKGNLGCISLKARARDYDPAARPSENGAILPYREHVRRLREDKVAYPRYLLVLSNVSLEGEEDRMTAELVDTDLALGLFHDAPRGSSDWQEDVEARISASAVLLPPIRANLRDPDETRRFLEKLFLEDFRALFERASHWHPYGSILLEGTEAGLGVTLDGDTVGTTSEGATKVHQVLPGTHRVELVHPEYAPFSQDITVTAGGTTRVEGKPSRVARTASSVHRLVFWSGVATAVAGAALTVYGITRPIGGPTTACFDVPGSECVANSKFVTFGYDKDATIARDVNPSGVMIVPLGYSLASTGAAWSIGSLLTDESDIPWIPVVAGLGLGVLLYGASAILDGPGVP
jgi:hypothetical protein